MTIFSLFWGAVIINSDPPYFNSISIKLLIFRWNLQMWFFEHFSKWLNRFDFSKWKAFSEILSFFNFYYLSKILQKRKILLQNTLKTLILPPFKAYNDIHNVRKINLALNDIDGWSSFYSDWKYVLKSKQNNTYKLMNFFHARHCVDLYNKGFSLRYTKSSHHIQKND